MLTRVYERYGGCGQFQPLSDAEKLYDETCRAINYAEEHISSKRAGLFTAGELFWFGQFTKKMWFGPNQEIMDRHLLQLGNLLKTLEERERSA